MSTTAGVGPFSPDADRGTVADLLYPRVARPTARPPALLVDSADRRRYPPPFGIRAEWSNASRHGHSRLTQRTSAVYAIRWWWWWWFASCVRVSDTYIMGVLIQPINFTIIIITSVALLVHSTLRSIVVPLSLMRWLQLRFDFDSTAIRLLVKGR